MNSIPPVGQTGVLDTRNPTLVPNFYRKTASAGGTLDNIIPASVSQRVDATATATIAGSVTSGDEITLVVANPVLGGYLYGSLAPAQISHTVTAGGGDTATTIAEALATAFNDDAIAQRANIRADVAGAVITFRHSGPIGNLSVLSSPFSEPSTITIGGTALTGDQICVLFSGPAFGSGILVTSNTTTSQSTTTMASNLSTAINGNTTLAALGVTATPSSAVISLVVPAALEPATITTWVNTIAPTATVGGTLTVGDTLQLTFTNAALPGGSRAVTYTTVTGDTTTTMAAGLAALVNADPVLIAAGITASPASAVVTFSYQAASGQLRLSKTVGGSATETVTLSTTPTETSTFATAATETVTLSPSNGVMSGGTGAIFAAGNFSFPFSGVVTDFMYGQPYHPNYPLLAAMVSQGMPIV